MDTHAHAATTLISEADKLAAALRKRAPSDAFALLEGVSDALTADALMLLDAAARKPLMERFTDAERLRLFDLQPELLSGSHQASDFPDDCVGHLMSTPTAIFPLGTSIETVIQRIRELASRQLVIYAYVVDEAQRLKGLITMRDLLLAAPFTRVEQAMLAKPFHLLPTMKLEQAMRETARRHYPLYPVCDAQGHLVGTVAGATLFEALAFEISAQSGRMHGVDSAEKLATPWPRSLRLRHPWLQVNLLSALLVGVIVNLFADTTSRFVILAAFIPVLSSLAANTGCQTLAVTLRAIALNEYGAGIGRRLLRKETLLGMANGVLVGAVAAIIMYVYAVTQHTGSALQLASTVLLSMIGACLIGGLAGVAIPALLRRYGADPATASSIFLTTITDLVGMSLLLGLATLLAS